MRMVALIGVGLIAFCSSAFAQSKTDDTGEKIPGSCYAGITTVTKSLNEKRAIVCAKRTDATSKMDCESKFDGAIVAARMAFFTVRTADLAGFAGNKTGAEETVVRLADELSELKAKIIELQKYK